MEMIHETRIIPLDGRAHLPPAVRQWLGDLRGRWEGPERFTRVDANTIDHAFTAHDPTT